MAPPDAVINPLAARSLPNLEDLVGSNLTLDASTSRASGRRGGVRPIDALLGVAGLPQSGTGQTSLLTGTNAQAQLGRHFGPWVPTTLRPLLERENVFVQGLTRGLTVQFANSYPSSAELRPDDRRPGAFPFAARVSGALVRDERDLREGNALVSSITTDGWRKHVDPDAPVISPEEAGSTLARLSRLSDLTLFAHFDTDYIGHRGNFADAIAVISRLDSFVGAVAEALPADSLLVLTSDHGNIEDMRSGHTRNPVPLVAIGQGADRLIEEVDSIADVIPGLFRLIDSERRVQGASARLPERGNSRLG